MPQLSQIAHPVLALKSGVKLRRFVSVDPFPEFKFLFSILSSCWGPLHYILYRINFPGMVEYN